MSDELRNARDKAEEALKRAENAKRRSQSIGATWRRVREQNGFRAMIRDLTAAPGGDR